MKPSLKKAFYYDRFNRFGFYNRVNADDAEAWQREENGKTFYFSTVPRRKLSLNLLKALLP